MNFGGENFSRGTLSMGLKILNQSESEEMLSQKSLTLSIVMGFAPHAEGGTNLHTEPPWCIIPNPAAFIALMNSCQDMVRLPAGRKICTNVCDKLILTLTTQKNLLRNGGDSEWSHEALLECSKKVKVEVNKRYRELQRERSK